MKDLIRRLAGADVEVATEMIRRDAFEKSDLRELAEDLAEKKQKPNLQYVLQRYLCGMALDPQAAFIPALANADRQLAIHAVLNAKLTDADIERLEKLLKLQKDGHLLKQLVVAVELEINRRRIGGKRGSRNRITTRRG